MGCISVKLTTVISSLDQSPPLDKEVRGMIHADRNETIQFAYFEFLNLMSINTKVTDYEPNSSPENNCSLDFDGYLKRRGVSDYAGALGVCKSDSG
ncbi:hypothetical protein SAY86_026105 [Trapa natans]|uniref:Uncharacterized protein n=1 Tax=Trapa natans TaxID=22666 RepID=A0AAN7KD48_TRANT|nr:hypothetical protein SAY86_026105 [Trapa natans]